MGRQTSPQGGTRFRMLRAQFWTLAQSKYISEGTQKWTLLGSKVVPPGRPVFGPFILSDVLKLCKLLCAQNVKLEATLTQTASVAGILNCYTFLFGLLYVGRLADISWFSVRVASTQAKPATPGLPPACLRD